MISTTVHNTKVHLAEEVQEYSRVTKQAINITVLYIADINGNYDGKTVDAKMDFSLTEEQIADMIISVCADAPNNSAIYILSNGVTKN